MSNSKPDTFDGSQSPKPPTSSILEAKPPASNLKPQTSSCEAAKPLASISFDLDNQWSYMKTHGDSGWEKLPTFFNILIPHVLDVLKQLDLNITFMLVGLDASLDPNKEYIKLVAQNGHEIGNHSFNHEPWLQRFTRDQIQREVIETDSLIQHLVGLKPVGFRGPGFSWSKDLFEILVENGYAYDSSTFPTYLGPLARRYYFWTANFTREEMEQRKDTFGTLKDGLRPVGAYQWVLPNDTKLLEIPVTTIPIIKTPIHLSYLIWLSRYSWLLMWFYLKIAISLCKLTKTEPSFLLHPTDIIGGDQVPQLAFFPGMDLNGKEKTKVFRKIIGIISENFELINMSKHTEYILKNKKLKTIKVSS